MSESANFELPEPRTDTLENPPLELVVCQVRHEPKPEIGDPTQALRFKAVLGGEYSRLEPVLGAELTMAPGGAQPVFNQRPSGWRLVTSDGGLLVSLTQDSFAIECSQYTTWTSFYEAFVAVVAAVDECFGPQLTQRVGVRYVDRMWKAGATKPSGWAGLLEPSVLGLGSHASLSASVLVAQSTSELRVGDYRATIRGSLATDQNPSKFSMVLDTDCYDERSVAFERAAVQDTVQNLHRLNLQLFQALLTDDYYEELKG